MYDLELQETIQRDFNKLIIGKKIGQGQYRQVYEYLPDPKLVIKFGTHDTNFSNIHEWSIWNSIKDTKMSKWFAPVLKISDYGAVLIMVRTTPLIKLPAKIPNFMSDTKLENWGLLNGRPVVHDYGNHLFFDIAIKNARMVGRT